MTDTEADDGLVIDPARPTRPPVQAPPELLDEIREDLRHDGTARCDRWFPQIEDGAPVVNVNVSIGLAWWTVALPIVTRAKVGDRVLVLDAPRPEAVGKVGILRSFDGFPCVDLQDGTRVRPLVREVALLPAPVEPEPDLSGTPTRDTRPHSRACGIRCPGHGLGWCARNCPTCHPEPESPADPVHALAPSSDGGAGIPCLPSDVTPLRVVQGGNGYAGVTCPRCLSWLTRAGYTLNHAEGGR